MCILVTGGSGFIGRRVIRKLLDKGEQVVVADIHFPSQAIAENGKTAIMDVRQFSDVIKVIHDFEVDRIIHLGYSGPPPSERFLHLAVEVNCLGTTNVFEAARICGVKRVVFPSSIAVYGPQQPERAVTEEDPLRPTLLYGATKVLNEFTAAKYEEKYGIEIPVLRLSIALGVGRGMGLVNWLSQINTDIPQGKTVFAPVRSDQLMAVVHVEDVSELFIKLCLAKELNYRVYNSGSHTTSGKEVAEIARKRFPDAHINFDENAPDLPYVYRVDGSRIAEEFKWRMMDLETALFTN